MVFARLASISSFRILSRCFSALALWICHSQSSFVTLRGVKSYMFHQCTLVLECVTFAQLVELVVEVLIDLAGGSVLDKKASENSEASHPKDLAVILGGSVKSSATTMQIILGKSFCAYLGILASFVPFLLPKPRCRPILLAAFSSLARALECMATGLRMISPSLTNFRIVCREFALEISLTSLGSSQILRLPQPTTDAARRF